MKFEEALAAMREGKRVFMNDKMPIGLSDIEAGEFGELTMADIDAEWEIHEEPKREPEQGKFHIEGGGYVCFVQESHVFDVIQSFGCKRQTKEGAEKARDKMRAFNRLLAYVDEHSKDVEERNTSVFLGEHSGQHYISTELSPSLGVVLMPARVAEQLCDDLNSGRVVL